MRLSNYLASCMRNYRIRDNPFRANFTYLARWANLAKKVKAPQGGAMCDGKAGDHGRGGGAVT